MKKLHVPSEDEAEAVAADIMASRQAERSEIPGGRDFRATARRIAVQVDIEETMWRMLGKEPERP